MGHRYRARITWDIDNRATLTWDIDNRATITWDIDIGPG